MTDIGVSSTSYLPADRPWLLFEATGPLQSVPTVFGNLDFALFTAATHYPDGFLPSGLVLGRVTAGGLLGPYVSGASDGRQTPVGFLYNATTVPTPLSRRIAAAIVDCFAVISESRLPANSGFDAAARTALASGFIRFRACRSLDTDKEAAKWRSCGMRWSGPVT